MASFEINFSDLNEEAKKRYLAFQRVSNSEDINTDCCPLAIIELDESVLNEDQEA